MEQVSNNLVFLTQDGDGIFLVERRLALTAAGGIDATLELNFEAAGGSVVMSTLYVDAATNGDDVAYAVIYV